MKVTEGYLKELDKLANEYAENTLIIGIESIRKRIRLCDQIVGGVWGLIKEIRRCWKEIERLKKQVDDSTVTTQKETIAVLKYRLTAECHRHRGSKEMRDYWRKKYKKEVTDHESLKKEVDQLKALTEQLKEERGSYGVQDACEGSPSERKTATTEDDMRRLLLFINDTIKQHARLRAIEEAARYFVNAGYVLDTCGWPRNPDRRCGACHFCKL
ncbi:MAG: hypothetical protein U9Q07_05395, partial [Planctomycetota bacterium]|nr:hypothetical protein [Planctomycetota bacterium]